MASGPQTASDWRLLFERAVVLWRSKQLLEPFAAWNFNRSRLHRPEMLIISVHEEFL